MITMLRSGSLANSLCKKASAHLDELQSVRIYDFKLEGGGVNCLKRVFPNFSTLNEITSRKP